MLKKILATALAAAMIFGLAATAFAAPVFPDTASVANENVIARLKSLGIVKGDDLGNFNPNNPINRAEFTTMVVRMLGLETAATYLSTPTAFPDVTANYAWAYGYINIATGRGLIKGYEDGTFRPSSNVTQAEALTILIRALGYNDNLPGDWPTDYVMKGAELEIIADGFTGGTAATRALVATLVNNTLDKNLVKEPSPKDAPGEYDDKYAAPTTLYKDAFGLRGASVANAYLSGLCTAVSTKNSTITIGTNPAADYISGVVVYGKDDIEDLVGQYVKATVNKDGKVFFVAVTTKQEVVGEITAVDTVNLKVTVGGTQYTVLSGAEVVKNGATLTTTIAGALAAVKDSNATLLFNSDGKVYRIVASLLDKEGTITGKSTAIGADGKAINKLLIDGKEYSLTSDTTIVRNGATAAYADLLVDDEVDYSVNDTKLVYIDAFINVVKGYKVTNYISDSSGAVIKATKDGVESTFTVAKNSSGTLLVNMGHFTAGLGKDYDLTLNRDGKVKKIAETTVATPSVGKVKTVASKDTVYNSTAGRYDYRLSFTDGTVLNLSELVYNATGSARNGVAITLTGGSAGSPPANLEDAYKIWDKARPNDMFWMTGATTARTIELFAPSVSGRVEYSGGKFYLFNSSGTKVAEYLTGFGTSTTLNGVAVAHDSLTPRGTGNGNLAAADYVSKVTFGAPNPETIPGATSNTAEVFTSVKEYPVSAITSTSKEYTYTVDDGSGTPIYVKVNVSTTDGVTDGIIVRGGAKVTAADIAIGDKIQFAALSAQGVNPYVKATVDDEEPEVWVYSTKWTDAVAGPPVVASSFVVAFKSDEPVRKGYVWLAGEEFEATYDGTNGYWTKTFTGLDARPTIVTVAVLDYAGQMSTAVDRPVIHVATGTPHIYLYGIKATITDTTLDISDGDTGVITVTRDPATGATNQNLTYTSSNTGIATVTPSGTTTAATATVAPVAAGTCVISVTSAEGGFTVTFTITVQP